MNDVYAKTKSNGWLLFFEFYSSVNQFLTCAAARDSSMTNGTDETVKDVDLMQ